MNLRGLVGLTCVATTCGAVITACGTSTNRSSPAPAEAARSTVPPLPEVSRLASAAQQRLREQHAAIEKVDGPAARAEALGAMGRLLLAAELPDAAEPFLLDAQRLATGDERWPYYRAQVARQTNRPADAAPLFERALAIQPSLLPALIWAADAYVTQGRPEVAEPHATKATEVEPRSASAWFTRGRVAVARGQLTLGIEFLERARALNPKADAISYQLGLALRRAGDAQRAEPLLKRPGDVASVVPVDPLMDALPSLLGGNGESYLVRGVQALDERRWQDATTDLRLAADLLPNDAGVRVNLATALYLSGDQDAARQTAEAATRLDPRLAKAHYVLGLILESSQRDADAIERFSTAVQIDANYLEALVSLGDALRRAGQVEAALTRYRQVLSLNPNATQVRFGYGIGLVRLGRFLEAAAWLDEGSKLHPDQGGYAHALARLRAAAPDPAVRNGAQALAVMQALGQRDRSVPVMETMAMALAETGRFDEAVSWQRRAIAAATSAGRADVVATLQGNLQLYRQRQPCREPWREDDPIHRPGAQPR